MVGFNYIITFNQNGKITDYQKSYNNENGKKVNIYLPLNFNNKKKYIAELSVAINNSFPKEIIKVEGQKSDTDLNLYYFDLTNLYNLQSRRELGLFRFKLYSDNHRTKFESESFRI